MSIKRHRGMYRQIGSELMCGDMGACRSMGPGHSSTVPSCCAGMTCRSSWTAAGHQMLVHLHALCDLQSHQAKKHLWACPLAPENILCSGIVTVLQGSLARRRALQGSSSR
jgi:hypothetical protein